MPVFIAGRRYAAAAGAFSPSSLSGLMLWLKSDTGVTSSVGALTTWADQSGVGNDVAPTIGGVQYSSTSFNSAYPGITTNLGAAFGKTTNTAFNSTSLYLFMALSVDNASCTQDGRTVALFSGATTNDFDNSSSMAAFAVDKANTKLYCYGNNGYVGATGGFSYTTNTAMQVGVVVNGSTAQLYKGGVAQGSTSAWTTAFGNTVFQKIVFGQAVDVALESAQATYAEIIMGSGTLTGTDVSNITTYLSGRYGI